MRRTVIFALVLLVTPLAAQRISTQASVPPAPVPGLSPDPFVFPNGLTPLPAPFGTNFNFNLAVRDGRFGFGHHGFRHHHHFRNGFGVPVPYAVPYYVVPGDYESETPEQPVNETPQYSGNDLERQMLLQHIANSEKESSANNSRYGEHYLDNREPRPTTAAVPTPAPEPPAPLREEDMLVLVFRDGHQLMVANYAIVGDTFYDLTPGHTRRIKLSDLDLVKTKQLNDDRGVDFAPPKSS
jgi:hypothetical protein